MDVAFKFRQDSNMYWATGVSEPDFHAVLDCNTGELVLVAPELPDSHKIWVGHVPSVDEIAIKYGADRVERTVDDALKRVLKLHPRGTTVHYCRPLNGVESVFSDRVVDKYEVDDESVLEVLSALRELKSDLEVQCLAHANLLSGQAHVELMRQVRGGMREYQLEALFVRETMDSGLLQLGYPVIVGSGPNSAVLHYAAGARAIGDRDLVLVDAGAEHRCFTADITRTFPADGRFSGLARDVYQTVLDMQELALASIEPGGDWSDLNDAVAALMFQRLKDIGVIGRGVSEEELLQAKAQRLFMPHNLGHHLGLDVHDVSSTGLVPEELRPGQVVTVEPGIYFIPALLEKAMSGANPMDDDTPIPSFLNEDMVRQGMALVGGVRIEDNVHVTDFGMVNLTRTPKTIAEIEGLRD